jgi:hypothetical protein
VTDRAYRYVLAICVFSTVLFGTLLRLASRSTESSIAWLELSFGFAVLVAVDWVAVLLYREVRRLRGAATH